MEGLPSPSSGGPANQAEEAAKQAQEEAMRHDLMATVLEPAARERLTRISLVSPERARQIESIIIRLAQSGQLRGKVSDELLIDLLEQAEGASTKSASKPTTIVYQRRRDIDDDFDI